MTHPSYANLTHPQYATPSMTPPSMGDANMAHSPNGRCPCGTCPHGRCPDGPSEGPRWAMCHFSRPQIVGLHLVNIWRSTKWSKKGPQIFLTRAKCIEFQGEQLWVSLKKLTFLGFWSFVTNISKNVKQMSKKI